MVTQMAIVSLLSERGSECRFHYLISFICSFIGSVNPFDHKLPEGKDLFSSPLNLSYAEHDGTTRPSVSNVAECLPITSYRANWEWNGYLC